MGQVAQPILVWTSGRVFPFFQLNQLLLQQLEERGAALHDLGAQGAGALQVRQPQIGSGGPMQRRISSVPRIGEECG